jgi:hypothetical protein
LVLKLNFKKLKGLVTYKIGIKTRLKPILNEKKGF